MIAKSPVAMKAAKQCLNLSLDVDLAAGLSYELKTWSALFATEDQKEGMKAFLENANRYIKAGKSGNCRP